MTSSLEGGAIAGVDARPRFGVTPAVPWDLQEHFVRLRADAPTWLPREELRRYHLPVLVASLWDRLMATVRAPVRTVEVDGHQALEIVSCARIRRRTDGQIDVQLRDLGDDGCVQWEGVADTVVALDGMPRGLLWLGLIRNAALVEIVQNASRLGITQAGGETGHYARELFDHFRRRLLRHADLRQMRRRVADALQLDQDVVGIARRFIRIERPQAVMRVNDYNLVVRHRAAFSALTREMPQAVPLYAALVERSGFPDGREPAQAVREYLAGHGLGPRTWRMICRSSTRLLLPVRDFYKGDVSAAVIDYLRALDRLGFDREPHAGLIWDMLSRYGHPGFRCDTYLPQIEKVEDSFAHVAKLFMRLPAERQATEREELEAMLEWIATRDRPPLDKLQRRAGWPWLLENTHDWRALRQAEVSARARRWEVPFDNITTGRYEVRLIGSVADLWAEARAQHHCAHLYAKPAPAETPSSLPSATGERTVAWRRPNSSRPGPAGGARRCGASRIATQSPA